MAMGTERSKALHNFTMPGDLRWGNQKLLRCMKVNSNAGQIPSAAAVDRYSPGGSDPSYSRRGGAACAEPEGKKTPAKGSSSPSSSGGGRLRKAELGCGSSDDGIAAVREKVLLDLQTAAEKMREAIFKNGLADGEIAAAAAAPPLPPLQAEGEAVRPWNLRTRRAPTKFPAGVGDIAAVEAGGGAKHDHGFPQTKTTSRKSPPARASADAGAGENSEKHERPKFCVALSKREIEEDFFSIVGHRPPRRPKKRNRTVQKQLDTLFPGLWLTEVTPDMYKVVEAAPP